MIYRIYEALKKRAGMQDIAEHPEWTEEVCFAQAATASWRLINRIHERVGSYEFKSVQEEIFFFKQLKPLVVSQWLFWEKMCRLEEKYGRCGLQRPAVLKKQLHKAERFLQKHHDFFMYLKHSETYCDGRYFRRQSGNRDNRLLSYTLNFDAQVSCSHGYLAAKLKASEQLRNFCIRRIQLLKEKSFKNDADIPTLQWTGTKAEAIELIYALQTVGVVNHGRATVKELAQAFESVFSIQVSKQLYRDFIDIKRRKIETTRFLNRMAGQLNDKIEDDYR